MGALKSRLFGPPVDTRPLIKGVWPRIQNSFRYNFRGILGCLFPLILLPWQPRKGMNDITVRCMWIWMLFFFLFQPVNIPVTGFIPIFLLPMTGAMSTVNTCQCYFNENIALYVLAGMLLLLINSCGLDRRIILWLLCSGDNCQFSGKRIVFKACTAAFFLSMFSSRLIVSSTIIQYLTPAFTNLQSSTASYRATEPNYDEMRYIVVNAVQVASAIGSSGMLHSAYTTLTMRAIWDTHPGANFEYPDIFNYLQYTCFAFPVTFVMFILTFSYHMLLLNYVVGKPMSASSMSEMKKILQKQKDSLPKSTSSHEMLCLFFYIFYLFISFFRWSPWLNNGWSSFYTLAEKVPGVKDATVAAIFVFVLHILPRTCSTLKFFIANTRSELGAVKPESSIMWWRFTDKNTNYGYIILIGSGIALNTAVRVTGLNEAVKDTFSKFITSTGWNFSLFLVCFFAVLLSSTMTGVAACCIFMPLVLNMVPAPTPGRSAIEQWQKKLYLGALAIGMGTSYGFTCPFLYTPAYFCHKSGKVPMKKMIKYSILPALICVIILWGALCSYAPAIFDAAGAGILPYAVGGGSPPPSPGPAPPPPPVPGPVPPGESEPAPED